MIGRTISHYKILERIGGGGMGVVYKAEDTRLKRPVALKFLPPAFATDTTTKERFIHEAQSASALQHNHICAIHEINETDDGQMYIVMDYYEGETLQNKIKDERLKIKEAIDITIQIAQGLQKAHEKGIIHRDIKPANIIITNDGEAKILDFGLAKFKGQTRITKTGSTLGTVAYMSPEQAKGEEVDHRSDIWSLGVILYEMVTGELPFKGDYDQALVYSILNEEPEPLNDIPSGLQGIIETALSKKPEERYQTIEDLLNDLQILKSESEVSKKMIGKRKRAKGKRIRYILYPAILIIIFMAWYFIGQSLESKEIAPVPIAFSSFENLTGDPAYEYLHKAIPTLLITNLEQSKYFQVNNWDRMKDLAEQAGKKDMEYIKVDDGIDLCKMDNIHAIATGSYTKIGDMFSIDVKILDIDTKKILKSVKSVGEGEDSIIKTQIDELSTQIATAVDIPSKEFSETKKPLVDVTTTDIEAYKYYLLGKESWDALDHKEAINYFSKALSLDSTFAMAHSILANAYLWDQSYTKMRKHLDLSIKFRYKATRKEQVLIDYMYDALKGGDTSKSIAEMEKAAVLYPKEKLIFDLLGDYYQYRDNDKAIFYLQKLLELDPDYKSALNQIGYRFADKGDYTKAIEYLQKYINVAPNDWNPYTSMGDVYLKMHNYEKSIEMFKKAAQIRPDSPSHRGIIKNYIKMHKYQIARHYIKQWSENPSYNPDRRELHYHTAILDLNEGDIQKTIKELDEISVISLQISDSIEFVLNQFRLAEVFYESDRINEAEKKMENVDHFIGTLNLREMSKINLRCTYYYHMTRIEIKNENIMKVKSYIELYKQHMEMDNTGIRHIIQNYFTLLGIVAYAEGNITKAIDNLKKSDLNRAFNSYHLALAYLKNNEKEKAIMDFEEAARYTGNVDISNEIYSHLAEKQLALLKASN